MTSTQGETEDSADCNAFLKGKELQDGNQNSDRTGSDTDRYFNNSTEQRDTLLCCYDGFSVIAVYEMLVTTKYLKNKFTSAVSLIFAAVTPIIFWIEPLRNNVKLIYFGFVVIMLLGMLFNHEKARFEQVALVAFVSITILLHSAR